ncbi:type IV secretory system conjugative DNA transfer family protein, partial [Shigella sonnei]
MKKQVCLLLSGLLLAGCAGQHHRPPAGMAGNLPPPDLRAWLTPTDNQDDGISDTRRQMLTDAGRTLGFRGGKAQRSWELIQALNARESTLNALYDFRPLISREGWLPPVID